jgi:hypothetical protein
MTSRHPAATPAASVDFCEETYQDALEWTKERRERELAGYASQLREMNLNTTGVRVIAREMRAVRKAIVACDLGTCPALPV